MRRCVSIRPSDDDEQNDHYDHSGHHQSAPHQAHAVGDYDIPCIHTVAVESTPFKPS